MFVLCFNVILIFTEIHYPDHIHSLKKKTIKSENNLQKKSHRTLPALRNTESGIFLPWQVLGCYVGIIYCVKATTITWPCPPESLLDPSHPLAVTVPILNAPHQWTWPHIASTLGLLPSWLFQNQQPTRQTDASVLPLEFMQTIQ